MHKGSRPEIVASEMSHLYQQAAETLVYSGRYIQYSMYLSVLYDVIKCIIHNSIADAVLISDSFLS